MRSSGEAPYPSAWDVAIAHYRSPARLKTLTVSVAIATYERPAFVNRCIEHLLNQTVTPSEIIVVDASRGADTRRLVEERFPTVRYEFCPAGRGALSLARNMSYEMTSGDVLAFIDDDAFAEPGWLEKLLPHYSNPKIGAVGGRQIRGQPDELVAGVDAIGLLRSDGTITGNFTADPGHPVYVDHLFGANMSFRRAALDDIGGIRGGYSGTCVREETDTCLRIAKAGYELLYVPDAVVEHVAAPYAKGQRFDLRYAYWAQKNHLIMLIRNFGPADPIIRSYLSVSTKETMTDWSARMERAWTRARNQDQLGSVRAAGSAFARVAVVMSGAVTGVIAGVRLARQDQGGTGTPRLRVRARCEDRAVDVHAGTKGGVLG